MFIYLAVPDSVQHERSLIFLCGTQDLSVFSSMTRDQTWAPCFGNEELDHKESPSFTSDDSFLNQLPLLWLPNDDFSSCFYID